MILQFGCVIAFTLRRIDKNRGQLPALIHGGFSGFQRLVPPDRPLGCGGGTWRLADRPGP